MICLDRYEITRDGRVYDKLKERELKSWEISGYLFYRIVDQNGIHIVAAHRLVAQTYASDWFEECVVHHKDHNRKNNSIENLECMTEAKHLHMHKAKFQEDLIKICPVCKKEFVWSSHSQVVFYHNSKYKNKGNAAGPFCSSKCALRYALTKRNFTSQKTCQTK